MKPKSTNRKIERWKIAKLKDHPKQAMFGDLPESELDALAAHMEANGQQDPIEILPDGTIIAGHQRVLAAKKLGWKEIDAIIRHDLAEAGEAAIESHFITSNLLRRQLTPLGKVRCIQRLLEIETEDAGTLAWGTREELKGRVAKSMKLDIRSVNRYLLILNTPVELQSAFDRGDIGITEAGAVSYLADRTKAEIAGRIAAGENAKQVVSGYVSKPASPRTYQQSFGRLRRAMHREIPQLAGNVKQLDKRLLPDALPLLKQVREFIDEVITAAKGVKSMEDTNDLVKAFELTRRRK